MKKWTILLLAVSTLVAFSAEPVLAGGFRIPESGAKAMGLGNAFVGQADDPSAVQFNPAGITQLEGNRILLGATAITTTNDYDDGTTSTSAEKGNYLPPFFYYTNHFEGLGDGNWWFGLGLTSPFGLGTEWDVSTFNYVATKTNLEMINVNPVMAYRANDKWSLAFGIDYYQVLEAEFQNDLSSTLVFVSTEGAVSGQVGGQKLSGDGESLGFNVGSLFKPNENLSIGFNYRSGVEIDVDGDVSLTLLSTGTEFASFDASTKLNLPATAALGVSYKFSDSWRVNADIDWTQWSSYDKLEIKDGEGTVRNPLTSEKDYDDTIAYRIGAEYSISENWALRGGFLMEPTPVPEETYEPRLPDGDRTGYVLGVGYSKNQWTADIAYMFVKLDKTTVDSDVIAISDVDLGSLPAVVPTAVQDVDGDYEGDITLIGFSVGYKF